MLLIYTLNVKAEKDSLRLINNLQVGLNAQYGAIYPHHSSIQYVTEDMIHGAELMIATRTYGKSDWDQLYRYPRYGIGYLYTSLGNNNVHGKANAVFLSLDIPFSSKAQRVSMGYQFSAGIAYINKIFDINENPLNLAISNHLNIFASAKLNAAYRIMENSDIYASFCLSHFSNGKWGTPNRGLNLVAIQLGYRTNLISEKYDRISYPITPFAPIHYLDIILSGGSKSDDQLNEKFYLISSLVFDYDYRFSKKYAIGGGMDFFYDAALGPNLEAQEERSATESDLYQMGIHGAISVRISRLKVYVHVGRYLYARYTKYSRFYGRLGVRYDITPKIMLNLSIKSHYAIADYFEGGVGYRINFSRANNR